MLHYLIYSIVSLGICFAGYMFILKKEKCFNFNRFFLLGTLLLCLVAPALEFSMPNSIPNLPKIADVTFDNSIIEESQLEYNTIEVLSNKFPTTLKILIAFYMLVTLAFLVRYGKNLFDILKLLNQVQFKTSGLNVIYIQEQNSSFSFFNFLFIHKIDFENETYGKTIINHELTHSKQLHSLDVIIIEFITCFFWFNPFIWFYKLAIAQNHEFIADAKVIELGMDVEQYSNTIIQLPNQYSYSLLSSGFNFIQTKNRIIMIHQTKSSLMKLSFKVFAAITLTVAVFTFSSFTDDKSQLVVVIDAGHGGHDFGNDQEKEVVLKISKKLAQFSNQKIKIIETRTMDKFLTLEERVDFINKQTPDLLISLHCNATKSPEKNGTEAFYYDKSDYHQKSYEFSKEILKGQVDLFSGKGTIKTAGFYILKNINCPGVLLELGFLTNEKDRAILTDENSQKMIAESIYQSLLKIRETVKD